jgi:hypothetical protein
MFSQSSVVEKFNEIRSAMPGKVKQIIYQRDSKADDEEEASFLHQEISSDSFHTAQIRQDKRLHLFKIFFLVVSVLVLLTELVFLAVHRPSTALTKPEALETVAKPAAAISPWQDCGHDAETAMARGCKFDMMTINWEPPQCYYPTIVSAFQEKREWNFYNQINPTEIVPLEEASLGSERFHVPWDFHFTHCNYAWRMMRSALISKSPLPENVLSMGHTRHCMEVWTDRRWKMEEMHTLVHVKWPKCYEYGDWNKANYVEVCGADGCEVKSSGASE